MFRYDLAFTRNLGLVTAQEQQVLKSKKIAIAGMGGVGGSHLLTLARMGIQNFHIADMDHFEMANFNRQAGAFMSTIGRAKTDVMHDTALEINPECHISVFSDGVTEDTIDSFLDDIDIYIDGLDFFALDIRAKVFAACRQKGIPAITAGPMGASTAYLVFDPKGMSFEDYFQFDGQENSRKMIHFLVGLTPRLPELSHFVDMDQIDFKNGGGSSLGFACMASSAVIGAETLKLLLARGKTHFAPWALQFDMYQNRYHKVYNFLGNRNPINKMKINYVLKRLEKHNQNQAFQQAGRETASPQI